MLKTILNNKIFIYLATRYMTYGLQFILSLVIAIRLGPYYLGIYGFLQLILSYFSQVNFGISHSLNVWLVHNKSDKKVQDCYSLNSYAIFTVVNVCIILVAVLLALFGKTSFGGYDIGEYFIPIVAIAVLTYYNSLISTVIRFWNKVNLMSLFGTIPVILNLFVVFMYREESLVYALIIANLISCIVIMMVGIMKKAVPKPSLSSIKVVYIKKILKKGFYLFMYNSCFYFILISVRSIISSNYTIEEFGFFTFSYTIANAVMLLLDSLNMIIFPKTIDVLSNPQKEERMAVLNKLRVGYITTSHFLAYVAMCCFPLLLHFIPKYQPALTSLNMIMLTILMNTNSYGYNTLLIANKKEKISSRISFLALLLTIIVALILIKIFKVQYSYVALSMLLAYLIFSFFSAYEGQKLLLERISLKYTMTHFFPVRLMLPYTCALIISFLNIKCLIFVPILLFLILNFNDLFFLKNIIRRMISNPNMIDV